MREWIVTNGLGSYASLTYNNTTNRKFHGLLIASLNPPTQRWVFLSNILETLKINDTPVKLQETPNQITYDHFPVSTYIFPEFSLKKTFFMPHYKNTLYIKYEIHTTKPVEFILKPIVNSRHFYDVTTPESFSIEQKHITNGIQLTPSNINKKLRILIQDATYQNHGIWMQTYYQKDHQRNESWVDYNYIAGSFHKKIQNSSTFHIICTIEEEFIEDPETILQGEIQRKKTLITQADLPEKFTPLLRSSDDFIVQKRTGRSIVAGYHWFADWGRDILISLPGLTLIPKRFDDAKQILIQLSQYTRQGFIPNAFMDRDSEPVYNTVDASLWFIDRVYQYMKYTDDVETLQNLWPTLEQIIRGYQEGTSFSIHMDSDFLISHNAGLTWMDVKLGSRYSTPRAPKAVEIQALWFNALAIMSEFAQLLEKNNPYEELALNVKDHFTSAYDQYYDVIDTKDIAIRPNQIFLVSLDFLMIPKKKQNHIVSTIENHLVTPFGLRTLSPEDSRYKGAYIGLHHRDEAYHNGTVWPWLLGPFITAYIKIHKDRTKARSDAFEKFLEPMMTVYGDSWDGCIYEIFDGNPPYLPRGCITQAWSVAEILRCWVEDIENIRPKYEDLFLHKIRV